MAKRKRRYMNASQMQRTKNEVSPTKPFEYANPNDPNDIWVYTVRQLTPGDVIMMEGTAAIKFQNSLDQNQPDYETAEEKQLRADYLEKVSALYEGLADPENPPQDVLDKERALHSEYDRQLAKHKADICANETDAERELREEREKQQEEYKAKKTQRELIYAAEITAKAVIDKKTNAPYMTKEDVIATMQPDWISEISTWAFGSLMNQGRNATEVDTFHRVFNDS